MDNGGGEEDYCVGTILYNRSLESIHLVSLKRHACRLITPHFLLPLISDNHQSIYVTFSLSIHLSIGILVVSTVNSAATNRKVQISLGDHNFNSFIEIPRNGIAG